MTSRNLSQPEERLHVKFIAGCLCLDFVNTVGGWINGFPIRDKISSYEDLLQWSRLSGGLDDGGEQALARAAGLHTREAAAVLKRAKRLREALYRIFDCAHVGRRHSEGDADLLRAELDIARANQRLDTSDGKFSWTLADRQNALDRILWPVALSAAELLTSSDLSRLRCCGAADCGWLFLDTSRNRHRRWCDMKDCGNRAKVKRFRAKRSA